MRNVHILPKEIQKGIGMECSPMEQSLAAANLDRIRTVVSIVRKEVEKVDNEHVNPFKIIASFKHASMELILVLIMQRLSIN